MLRNARLFSRFFLDNGVSLPGSLLGSYVMELNFIAFHVPIVNAIGAYI